MTFKEACNRARIESFKNQCGQHVNATIVLAKIDGEERCAVPHNGFNVSDWYDGSTVATFDSGIRKT